jgi:hypothetical protein
MKHELVVLLSEALLAFLLCHDGTLDIQSKKNRKFNQRSRTSRVLGGA